MLYKRLCKGVQDYGTLLNKAQFDKYEFNTTNDFYESIFLYNDTQYQQFQEVGSIRGITDVVSNKLVWDFDCEQDPDFARQEARTVVYRLLKAGVHEKDLELYFSGNKGFNISITLDRFLTPENMASLAFKWASDVKIDSTLYDAPQILRIPFTRHPKSGLFKIPLTYSQFMNDSLEEIKYKAGDINYIDRSQFKASKVDYLSDEFYFVQPKEVQVKSINHTYKLDLSNKPSNWKNCKWSLLQGNFKAGERHEALTILAATSRGMGFDRESSYYLCKSALKKQANITNTEEFPKEELWTNIIDQSIFSDRWEGGQYTCKKHPWLSKYCQSLGDNGCKDNDEEEKKIISIDEMLNKFQKYAENFDNNIIKTGITLLDENWTLCTSSLNGVLGQPGAGKTSAALNILEYNSMNDIGCVFFSLDMGLPLVTGNLVKKIKGCNFIDAMKYYKEDPNVRREVNEVLKYNFKNVAFDFSSGVTVADMKNTIKNHEQTIGKRIKVCIIDYLECVAGPFSDQTANAGFIANQLKDLANQLEICIILLLQTQKHSTSEISDPLLSMKNIKGASLIEQSCSTVLTLWREGYNPDTISDDRYLSHAIVKNRFGPLWRGDFGWDGVTGTTYEMSEEEEFELAQFRKRKVEKKLREMEFANSKWD